MSTQESQGATELPDGATPFVSHRNTYCYNVSYFDAVNGGSGLVSVPVSQLHLWLRDRPGVLIRGLSPMWSLH